MHGWYEPTEFLSVRYYNQRNTGIWWTTETEARTSNYYRINGFPTVVFQGVLRFVGANNLTATGEPYRQGYLSLKASTPWAIEVTSFDAAAGTVEFLVKLVSDPGPTVPLVFRSALYEDNLWTGGARHDRVTRDILPDEPITITTPGQTQVIRKTLTLDPTWKVGDLDVVGFIQNDATKDILQAVSTIPGATNSFNYWNGRRQYMVPPTGTITLDEIGLFNTGTVGDTLEARLTAERAPAGWSAVLTDGTTTDPAMLSRTASPGTGFTFNVQINVGQLGWGVYRVDLSQAGNPARVRSLRFSVVTEGLPILFVDDDEGASYETYYQTALETGSYVYGVWDLLDAPLPAASLSTFPILVWNVGWPTYTLTGTDRANLASHLDRGGKLFLTGQDIGWDFYENADRTDAAAAQQWYQSYLRANYLTDGRVGQGASIPESIQGVTGDPIGDGLAFSTVALYDQWCSRISPRDVTGTPVFQYLWDRGTGTIKVDTGTYRLVYMAFGFEAIDTAPNRAEVMRRIIEWLGYTAPPVCSGIPARVPDFALSRSGTADILFTWNNQDPAARGGYNVYHTDDPTLLATLRRDGNCGADCSSPILTAAPGPTAVYQNGMVDGKAFFQMLGACETGTEGPN